METARYSSGLLMATLDLQSSGFELGPKVGLPSIYIYTYISTYIQIYIYIYTNIY